MSPQAASQEMALQLKKRLKGINESIALLTAIREEIKGELNARR